MSVAWKIFRKGVRSFAVARRMVWTNAKVHNAAKIEIGISEENHTLDGWRDRSYVVVHKSKALYCAILSALPPRVAQGKIAT